MGLGLALVKAANTGGGRALHGPAFVFAFVFGASIQGLKRIAWAASDGIKVRSSGLCLLMQAGALSAQNRGSPGCACAHVVTPGTRLCAVKPGDPGLFKDRWDWGCGCTETLRDFSAVGSS